MRNFCWLDRASRPKIIRKDFVPFFANFYLVPAGKERVGLLRALTAKIRRQWQLGCSFLDGIWQRSRAYFDLLPLSNRLLLGLGVIIVAFTAISVAWDIYEIRQEAEREMIQRARVVTQELVALRAVIASNQDKINTDPVTGNVQFKHLNPAAVGRQVAALFGETTRFTLKQTRLIVRNPANEPDQVELAMLKELADRPEVPEIWRDDFSGSRWYFRYMIPLRAEESCLACHGEPAGAKDVAGYPKEGLKFGDFAGAISLKIPMDSFQATLEKRIWGRILMAGLFLLITRWASSFLARRLVSQPLQEMSRMALELGQGNWGAVKAIGGAGEIRFLSEVFEQVAHQLHSSHLLLEEKVRERTRELAESNASLARANRELEEANRFKSDVLANLSHELRTPLTAILAYNEMLLDPATGPLNPEQREYLEEIGDSGRQLLLEVTDLLQMARLEAGKLELALEPLDLVEVIADTLALIGPLARKKNIQLEVPAERGEWWALADRTKVRHILNNLLNNAIKFTPEGGRVTVFLERHHQSDFSNAGKSEQRPAAAKEDGQCLLVGVSDNGIGIPEEEQEAIFEKFHQVGKPGQGVGLGLALAKELVQLHGGRIWVQSQMGRGSTFYFTLPLRAEPL